MKKMISLLLFLSAGILFAQHFTTENLKKYTGQTYHMYFLLGAVELNLETNGTYTARYESEGMYWYNTGKYKLEKGLIKLSAEVCKQFADTDENVDCSTTLGEAKIDLIVDEYSLYYKEYLFVQSKTNKQLLMDSPENDNFRVPVPGTEVPEGEQRMIKNIPVTTMGMRKGITTSAVKIRKTPDAEGEEIPYYPALFEPEQRSVPNNTNLTVVARTNEKVKIGKWENYWYYVNVGANDGVWMFGEFVKFN
jgi:hypothetical protein